MTAQHPPGTLAHDAETIAEAIQAEATRAGNGHLIITATRLFLLASAVGRLEADHRRALRQLDDMAAAAQDEAAGAEQVAAFNRRQRMIDSLLPPRRPATRHLRLRRANDA